MPRPNLPPTPAASTDLVGQDKSRQVTLESSFTLPPPALHQAEQQSPTTSPSSPTSASASSYNPATPTSPTHKALTSSPRLKRTSSGSTKRAKDDFALPPPPTRHRKIIHMKPKSSTNPSPQQPLPSPHTSTKSLNMSHASHPPSSSNSKRKPPSSTSVAGRKIARKTAHSLIERRRRSKMNEEFATLKDMIPACEGQEMHKLAILQASIEYVRYLESCIHELREERETEDDREDTSMKQEDQHHHHQQQQQQQKHHHHLIASPSSAADADPSSAPVHNRQYSFTSTTASTATTLPSPAFAPSSFSNLLLTSPDGSMGIRPPTSSHHHTPFMASTTSLTSLSASPSPNMLPQPAIGGNSLDAVDRDHHEATAALLMLTNDRRGMRLEDSPELNSIGVEVKRRATGISVRELLST